MRIRPDVQTEHLSISEGANQVGASCDGVRGARGLSEETPLTPVAPVAQPSRSTLQ
jgi:hypothetical protein